MRVNIAIGATDLEWIGGRLARELVSRLPAYGIDAKINRETADLEYQQIVYDAPEKRPAVGFFTHGDFRAKRYASSYDGHVCMSTEVQGYLRDAGASNPVVIEMAVGAELRLGRPLVLGVAGRTYPDGRKGEHLVKAMVEAGYDIRAWGSGWPCKIIGDSLEGRRAFYEQLDYYVDTSSDEGGCVPALEAMALGIPVISHTLGVDRPVIAYDVHSWESLSRVLTKLSVPRTYEDWAREHAKYFKTVMGC